LVKRRSPFASRKSRPVRRCNRSLNRRGIRALVKGAGSTRDLTAACLALNRAIRAHRRLVKIAPDVFDPVVVRREAREREEAERWRQEWEPALNKIYGPDPNPSKVDLQDQWSSDSFKSPRLKAAIEFHLAESELWLKSGTAALQRFQQRHPRSPISAFAIARLLETASRLGELACGPPAEPEVAAENEFSGYLSPLAAAEKIYGRPNQDSAKSATDLQSEKSVVVSSF
jgi:hypothetical protein